MEINEKLTFILVICVKDQEICPKNVIFQKEAIKVAVAEAFVFATFVTRLFKLEIGQKWVNSANL